MEALRKPYIYFVIFIFFVYLLVDVAVSGFYNTFPLILIYAKTVNWLKLSISLILTLAIGILIALNAVTLYIRHKQRKKCGREAALSSAGAVGGLVAGVCPLCVTGLIPIIFGSIGISFSFALLPFQGIEVQALIVVVLYFSLRKLN